MGLVEEFHKRGKILILVEHPLTRVPPIEDMVAVAGRQRAMRSGHDPTLPTRIYHVNNEA